MTIHQVDSHDGYFGIWDRNGAFTRIRMGGVPVAAFEPGWHALFLTDLFTPIILLELQHDRGTRATWFLDDRFERIAGAPTELSADRQSQLAANYAGIQPGEIGAAVALTTNCPASETEDFRNLNENTQTAIRIVAHRHLDARATSDINKRFLAAMKTSLAQGPDPADTRGWLELAEAAYAARSMSAWLSAVSPEVEAAIARLSKPTRGLFLAWMGRAYLMEGKLSEARRAFTRAIDTEPGVPIWARRELEASISQDPGPFAEPLPPSLDQEMKLFIEAIVGLLQRRPLAYPPTGLRYSAFVLASYWLKSRARSIVLNSAVRPASNDGALSSLSPVFLNAARIGTREIAQVCVSLCPELNIRLGETMSDRLFEVIATARLKGKPVLCPFSGTRQLVRDSLDLSVYLHRYQERYCLIVSNEIAAAATNDCGWFLFEDDLLLVTESLSRVQNALALSLARSFENHDSLRRYLDDPDRSVMVSDISLGHIGHYIWNVISGWTTLFRNVAPGDVDIVASTNFPQFFGGVVDLYADKLPMVGDVVRWTHRHEIYREIIERRAICVILLDRYVTSDLANRVVTWCQRQCPEEVLERIASVRRRTRHLLLITLRLDNRCWVDQEDGIVEIISHLAEEFADFVAVLDGLNAGKHEFDSHAYMSLEAERSLVKKILARCPSAEIVDTIGSPLTESIVWCDTVDAFLAPVGAGMAKYRWITNRPGVAFSNETFMEPGNPGGHLYDHWRDDLIPIEYVDHEQVHDFEESRGEESRANFTMSWKAPYEKIRNLLARVGAEEVSLRLG